jgi:hypothetical protein
MLFHVCSNLYYYTLQNSLNARNPNTVQARPTLEIPSSKYIHNKHITLSNRQEQTRTVPH